jgi:RNA polymerase sigma-70 factor (ECF subfamily)
MREMCRVEGRHEALEEHAEPADSHIDLDAPLVTAESKELVRRVLNELSPKDRELLRTYYLEDENKGEMCDRFEVDRDYLRVLLHRAKARFRKIYEREIGAPASLK